MFDICTDYDCFWFYVSCDYCVDEFKIANQWSPNQNLDDKETLFCKTAFCLNTGDFMKKVPSATCALGIDRKSPLNECTLQELFI